MPSQLEYEVSEEVIQGDLLATNTPDFSTAHPTFESAETIVQAIDGSAMSATFIIVTRGKEPNRHGNMVQIKPGNGGEGLQLQNFDKNPVVLFNHGFGSLSMPIGTSRDSRGQTAITLQSTKATGTVFFSQSLPEAEQIFALVEERILNAASIQFLPTKARFLRMKGGDKGRQVEGDDGIRDMRFLGLDFIESELLEWSIVPIGADAGAIKKCLSQGIIGTAKITKAVRQQLKRCICSCEDPEKCTCSCLTKQFAGWVAPTVQVAVPDNLPVSDVRLPDGTKSLEWGSIGTITGNSIVSITDGITAHLPGMSIKLKEEPMPENTQTYRVQHQYNSEAVIAALVRHGWYIDTETDKETSLMQRVVRSRKTELSEIQEWDEARAVERLRNWAKQDASALYLDIEESHRQRYRQGFTVVMGTGRFITDYLFPHQTVVDGNLETVAAGMDAAVAAINSDTELDDGIRRQAFDQLVKEFKITAEFVERQAEITEPLVVIPEETTLDRKPDFTESIENFSQELSRRLKKGSAASRQLLSTETAK